MNSYMMDERKADAARERMAGKTSYKPGEPVGIVFVMGWTGRHDQYLAKKTRVYDCVCRRCGASLEVNTETIATWRRNRVQYCPVCPTRRDEPIQLTKELPFQMEEWPAEGPMIPQAWLPSAAI